MGRKKYENMQIIGLKSGRTGDFNAFSGPGLFVVSYIFAYRVKFAGCH